MRRLLGLVSAPCLPAASLFTVRTCAVSDTVWCTLAFLHENAYNLLNYDIITHPAALDAVSV
ncbi:MAG: hypothetical protein FWD26_02535 [Treponema sp.]|nr:hypothetical protein [Treponema sp.]